MWQSRRSTDLEILDRGPAHYTQQQYSHCLYLLGRINQWLGGFGATYQAFMRLGKKPQRILEVGCGGGHLCQKMATWFPHACITGIDLDENAVREARGCIKEKTGNIKIEKQEEKKLKYCDNQFDVVTTMLVCHHMDENELVEFLKESYRIASCAVIINDLHRHILAYCSFSLIAPLVFRNPLIWNDGRLSIRRSFRRQDWVAALKQAGFNEEQYELRWNWAFRWTLTIKK